jgi:hypothetical protein
MTVIAVEDKIFFGFCFCDSDGGLFLKGRGRSNLYGQSHGATVPPLRAEKLQNQTGY